MPLKGNQKTRHDGVVDYINRHMENNFADVISRTHSERLQGHGREDALIYYQLPVPRKLPGKEKWKGLRTIGVVIRTSANGEKQTSDVRYYSSSLPLGVKRFSACVRGTGELKTRFIGVLM